MRHFLADLGLFVFCAFLIWLAAASWVFFECRRTEKNRLRLMGESDVWGRFRHDMQDPQARAYPLVFGSWYALYAAETIPGRIVLGLVALVLTFRQLKIKR